MRPTNSPSPSAPPSIQSNPQHSSQTVQMPKPFGSGIGFKPQVTNPSLIQNPPTGYPNVPQPNNPQAAPSNLPYPSHPQTPNNSFTPQTNLPLNQTIRHNYQSTQPHGHGQPNLNYSTFQTPPKIYPNLQHSAPFSYLPPNPNLHRSTSGYMRKVISGRF